MTAAAPLGAERISVRLARSGIHFPQPDPLADREAEAWLAAHDCAPANPETRPVIWPGAASMSPAERFTLRSLLTEAAYETDGIVAWTDTNSGQLSALVTPPDGITFSAFLEDLRKRAETRCHSLYGTPDNSPDAPAPRASRHIGDILASPTEVRWLKDDEIERGVIAVMSGPKGSYKSAQTLNWIGHVAVTLGEPVLWCTAEGTGVDRRFAAWLKVNAPDADPRSLPLRAVERPYDLTSEQGRRVIAGELAALERDYGRKPALCVVDTYSKYSSHKEEDNTETKRFVQAIRSDLCAPFDCTLLVVAHTGLSDKKRARGASALEADTDAAYIVSVERETVSITRERFKDSPSLPPLLFNPKQIDLGRRDENGKPVTSIVLVPVEAAAVRRGAARKEPGKMYEKAVLKTMREIAPSGAIESEDLLAATCKMMGPLPDSRGVDRRPSKVRDGITGLIVGGWLHRHDGDRIALHACRELPDGADDFDEPASDDALEGGQDS